MLNTKPQPPEISFFEDLETIKRENHYDLSARPDVMVSGHYIDMPGREFADWASIETTGNPDPLREIATVRVKAIKIIHDDDGWPLRATVEAAGVRKNIDAALFWNYGGPEWPPPDTEDFL